MTTKYKTGAKPSPPHKLLAAQPHIVVYAPPPQFAIVPAQLSFWKNDVDGICVTAEEAYAKACYSPEIFISDAEVVAWATAHGVLNGADLASVLDWMAQKGFAQNGDTYNDGGKFGVDYSNELTLQSAISQGPVKIAIDAGALPQSAGPPNGWHAFGGSPGQFANTDHCVSLSGYGPTAWLYQQLGLPLPAGLPAAGYLCFTWSSIGFVDHAWIMSTCVEAWLRSPTTIVVGPAPPGPTPTPSPVSSPYTIMVTHTLVPGPFHLVGRQGGRAVLNVLANMPPGVYPQAALLDESEQGEPGDIPPPLGPPPTHPIGP